MIKRILVILLLSIFVLQFVSAVDTKVTINTVPNHDVEIHVLANGDLLHPIEKIKLCNPEICNFHYSDSADGQFSFTFSSTRENFDLAIWLKKDNNLVVYKKIEESFLTGTPLSLDVYASGITITEEVIEEVNSTELNETLTLNETLIEEDINQTNKKGFTGFNISLTNIFSSKLLYYIVGFIALLVIAFFGLRFAKSKKPRKIKVTKLSEKRAQEESEDENEEKEESKSEVEKLINDAEAKIKRAQEELSGLRKQQRVKELQEKMIRDKEELERLSR